MKTYSEDRLCPKCDASKFDVVETYRDGVFDDTEEYIQRSCQRCSFVWKVHTRDWGK